MFYFLICTLNTIYFIKISILVSFDYSLRHKPMIFYAFDLEDFQEARGLTTDYED